MAADRHAGEGELEPRPGGWRWRRILAGALSLLAMVALWRYAERPEAKEQQLLPGLRYEVMLIDDPRRNVVHVLHADLTQTEVVVTPPAATDGLPLRGQTTTAFARAQGLDVAINGDFFEPWHAYHPFNYYPRIGEPVGPKGLAVGGGVAYGGDWVPGDTLFFPCAGAPTDERPDEPCAAISGKRLLRAGEPAGARGRGRHPRTAVCWAPRRLTLVVVDGRQPGYSGGMRLKELAGLLRELGCRDALNLDGGGSTTMALRTEQGVEAVNRPIHTRIVGLERPVANHLGLRVLRREAEGDD